MSRQQTSPDPDRSARKTIVTAIVLAVLLVVASVIAVEVGYRQIESGRSRNPAAVVLP